MSAIITNPLTRKRIAALYHVQMEDLAIANQLGIPTYKVKATRRDMNLMRTTAPKHKIDNPAGKKPGTPTVKKRPSNSNARVNQFAVLRAYLDQSGSKNMAKVAEQFACTRAYVSKVLQNAREGGLLNENNTLYKVDHDRVIQKALEAVEDEECINE